VLKECLNILLKWRLKCGRITTRNRNRALCLMKMKMNLRITLRKNIRLINKKILNRILMIRKLLLKMVDYFIILGGNLPTMDDPKLFACRCKPGLEKESVIQIINKFLMYGGQSIYSATFIEKFPGFIYVEADKEIHVR